jgi:F-type H+-transporting ATPase subunit a
MFADHTIGGVFDQLAPWIVPVILPIPLAVFVAFVQTMVFVMLSMVYLRETVPHEEHDHDEHGEHASRAEHQVAVAH